MESLAVLGVMIAVWLGLRFLMKKAGLPT